MNEYPKVLYKDGGSKLVKTAEEEAAIGKGWSESPAPKAEPVKEKASAKGD